MAQKIEKERAFACPYWKHDPIKHLRCLYHGQKTSRHIKTHLTRKHQQPIHCPICFRIFETRAAQRVHIVERSCHQSSDPCPYGDGISNDQISEIDNLPRGGSGEDKWYRIWDVIFPLQKRPASPYLDVEKFQQDIEEHYAIKYSNLDRAEVENPKTNVYTSFLASRSTLQVFDENLGSGRPQRLPFLNFPEPSLHEASGPYQYVPLGTIISPYKYSTHGNLSSTHPATTPYPRTDISSTGPEYNVINYYYAHDGGHTIQDKGRDEEQARLASLNPAFPATDSGYASGFNADRFLECHPDHPTDHDTQTVYSEATIVPKAQAQQYVFDLCESIQSRLQHPISKNVPPSLSHSLPRILKAFAIRIGLESSSQINKTIMHFIHQRVRSIAHHLQSVVLEKGGQMASEGDAGHDRKDDMSLREKMSLWSSKSKEANETVDDHELFQGVDDSFEEEDLDVSELINYNRVVLRSASFDWLMKSMENELLLKMDTESPTLLHPIAPISQTILENLPTGVISKSRPPVIHVVKLQFIAWPTIDQMSRGIAGQRPSTAAFESLAIACCDNDAQSLTIKEYMEQVWPMTWREIYNLLVAALDDLLLKTYVAVLIDGTQLSASVENGGLSITIRGSSYTIAECSDQLAWLRVTLGAAHDARQPLTQQTPLIVYARKLQDALKQGLSIAEMTNTQTLPVLCLGIDVQNIPTSSHQQQLWSQIIPGSYAIVPGYPILRRPTGYNGIEISPDQLLKLWQRSSAIPSKTTPLVLEGSKANLCYVNETENVFLWHIGEDSENPCDCHQRLHRDSEVEKKLFDESTLRACRHIVGGCDGTGSAIDVLEAEKLQGIYRGIVPSNDGIQRLVESPPAKPSMTSHDIQPRCFLDSKSQSRMDGYPTTIKSFDNGGSSDSGLESCMLSISDISGDTETFSPLLHGILENAAQRLYAEYRSWVCHGSSQTQGANSTSENTLSTVTLAHDESPSRPSHQLSLKRRHPPEDEDDQNKDSNSKPPHKRGKTTSSRLLACPFLKFNPEKHRRCFKLTLRRIRDVKQHIHRNHAPEFYCDRCSVIFPENETLQQHVNDIGGLHCTPSSTLDGVTYRQRSQLSRKSNKNSSEEAQWFAIWTIVFPEQQKPSTAYMDASLSEDVYLFENFCRNHSEAVLNTALEEARPLGDVQMANEELQRCLRSVLSRGLAQLFDDFHSTRSAESSGSATSLQNGSLSRARVTHPTPDSGFETASHYRTPHNRPSTGTQDVPNNLSMFDLLSPGDTRMAPNDASSLVDWGVDPFPGLFGDQILHNQALESADAGAFGQLTSEYVFDTNDPNLDSI